MKRLRRVLGIALSCILIVLLAYVGFIWLTYSRIEDDLPLRVYGESENLIALGEQYKIATYNIGFGAYSQDYSFFMDGGEHARALSEQAVKDNTAGALGEVRDADIALFQEVDLYADRSFHVDQFALLHDGFPGYVGLNAVCYDTKFLYYPLHDPIGASKACQASFSRFPVVEARRFSLPISQGFEKLFDLDRCFSLMRIPVEGGRDLCVFNVHMSAYISDESVQRAQIEKLMNQLKQELDAGNYVICGGDFNHDLPGDSATKFGFETGSMSWTKPFEHSWLPEGLKMNADETAPSCRNANEPYRPGHTFVITVDGFITSDNVKIIAIQNIDTQFRYSDHTPVVMTFELR